MSDAGYVELRRRKRGEVLLTLFAPRVTASGLHAPSLCAHRAIRAGTRVLFENQKYETPGLSEGMNRPPDGLFLRRVT